MMSNRRLLWFALAFYHRWVSADLPAAARCCSGPSLLADLDRGVCVDHQSRVVGKMMVTCATNMTIPVHSNITEIVIEPEGRVVMKSIDWEIDMPYGSFCLGNVTANNSYSWQEALVCADEQEAIGLNSFYSGVLMLVSVPFLVLTIIVYGLVPELRDLQGKSIICLCCSLTLTLGFAAYNQLFGYYDVNICVVRVFLGNYFTLAMFFWMNAITIQVFRTVRYRTEPGPNAFAWYSGSTWGLSGFILVVTLAANYIPGPHIVPGIGHKDCWFSGPREVWLYFKGPMAVSSIVNLILFIWSSIILWRQVLGTTQLKTIRYKFLLSLRLFVVMGIGWIFESMSFAHGHYHIFWVIADSWNVLQGILIFVLLVLLRKRALKGLVKGNYTFCLTSALKRCLQRSGDDENVDFVDATEASHALTDIK